ncbi:MAG: flavodoxin family protein [Chloroflexi bacterium]|nr:flavodoxin family protein [Chloroflexota bacterium]MBM4451535.1 flavodoxin family protein [Chloroflexota bacterium]MBM4453744.1 flavodoxin family protein [Chloroflexota bacterium]
MKIIGICGSPRKGNTEWMLRTLMEEAAKYGAEVELLLLRKMDVRTCRGCLTCEEGGKERKGICKIKDDMTETYPKLLSADAILLATPGYFEMLSGLLKNFLDRTCPIWPRLEGKKVVGLAVAEEGIGQAIQNLKTYASLCKMRWVGSATALAKTPGEVAQNKELGRRLKQLAKRLVHSHFD